jgi:hypothetical protein
MGMLRNQKKLWIIAVLLFSATFARAFSLLIPLQTPATTWQVQAIGYQLPGDIGGAGNIGEGYRWNIPAITYAFDSAFLDFFGQEGVNAVEAALGIINDVGPVSQLSPQLSEFPIEAIRSNPSAAALGILDLKSTALAQVLELLGLADPTRWVWTIRDRREFTIGNTRFTNYFVISRNFDPVTYTQSAFINEDQYNYTIFDPIRLGGTTYADAIEEPASFPDPLPLSKPVASFLGSGFSFQGNISGLFVTGLSRDDAGGLRYLYRAPNYAVESLLPDVTFASNAVGNVNSPWIPYFGITNLFTNVFGTTNITTTNLIQVTALRPGMETIQFVRVAFDSLLGQTFVPITNVYTDVIISNNVAVLQRVQRISNRPDLIFTAEDLGVSLGGAPFLTRRGVNFINNDALNGVSVLAGPGNLGPPAVVSFTTLLPGYFNSQPTFLSGPDPDILFRSEVWGSFGESPDDIIVYPSRFSLEELEGLILGQ